jgi:DNA-binding MarR family transcriptional regulator
MPAPNLTDSEYACLAEFRYILRVFLAFSEGQARAAGLNPQQHQLLLAVKGYGAARPTVGMLAARLMLRHHSTVGLIDRLEGRGLVARARSSADRRVASVGITARGTQLLRRLSLAHRDELKRAGPELSMALSTLLKARRHAQAPARAKAR